MRPHLASRFPPRAAGGVFWNLPGCIWKRFPDSPQRSLPGLAGLLRQQPALGLAGLAGLSVSVALPCSVLLRWTHYPLLSSSCPIKRFYGRRRPINARHAYGMHYVYAMRIDRRWFSPKHPAAQTKTAGFLRLLRVRLVSSTKRVPRLISLLWSTDTDNKGSVPRVA